MALSDRWRSTSSDELPCHARSVCSDAKTLPRRVRTKFAPFGPRRRANGAQAASEASTAARCKTLNSPAVRFLLPTIAMGWTLLPGTARADDAEVGARSFLVAQTDDISRSRERKQSHRNSVWRASNVCREPPREVCGWDAAERLLPRLLVEGVGGRGSSLDPVRRVRDRRPFAPRPCGGVRHQFGLQLASRLRFSPLSQRL